LSKKIIDKLPFINYYANQIKGIVEKENCKAIVACTADISLLPSAYYASKKNGHSFDCLYFLTISCINGRILFFIKFKYAIALTYL
jgi:hypothetical protein